MHLIILIRNERKIIYFLGNPFKGIVICCDESSLNSRVLIIKTQILEIRHHTYIKISLKLFLYTLTSLTSFILDSKFPGDVGWGILCSFLYSS